jgi:hypothetical protein
MNSRIGSSARQRHVGTSCSTSSPARRQLYLARLPGRRYHPVDPHRIEYGTGDPAKSGLARIFYEAWEKAEAKPASARMKADWKERYG